MPKYLLEASYTSDGVKGLVAGGGSARRDAVATAISGVGGTLEALYFAFGETDVYLIAEFPDNAAAAAVALTVSASGAVNVRTVVLLEPQEIDAAVGRSVDYRPPGR
jgi:uncharacterized protein with GYD domain